MTTAQGAALASLAGLLADRTRAGFCLALLDGRAWTASELARHAGVAASTASGHLDRLVAGGLLIERRQGRHRYLQLAGHQIAELVEDLAAAAGPLREPVSSLRAANASAALASARTCYDHLAGRLGVAIADAMTTAGLLDRNGGFAITEAGMAWLTATVGIDPSALRATRRPMVRSCLDWTERRTHLGGAVGAQICRSFLDRGWVTRIRSSRAIRLAPAGEVALRNLFPSADPLGW